MAVCTASVYEYCGLDLNFFSRKLIDSWSLAPEAVACRGSTDVELRPQKPVHCSRAQPPEASALLSSLAPEASALLSSSGPRSQCTLVELSPQKPVRTQPHTMAALIAAIRLVVSIHLLDMDSSTARLILQPIAHPTQQPAGPAFSK